jgi:hypothetical protein
MASPPTIPRAFDLTIETRAFSPDSTDRMVDFARPARLYG